MTRLVLETTNGIYTIVVPQNALTVYALVDEMVKPVLLAAGYSTDNVNDAIPDCDECEKCEGCEEEDDLYNVRVLNNEDVD